MFRRTIIRMAPTPNEIIGASGHHYKFNELFKKDHTSVVSGWQRLGPHSEALSFPQVRTDIFLDPDGINLS